MEKNNRKTVIHSKGLNVLSGDDAATSSTLDKQEDTLIESEPGPMDRTKEVMENIGIKINSF